MNIAIKSEMDSRILLYPLLKCLYPYGTIGVFTGNQSIGRLIDNDSEGGFKNISIVMVSDNDLQEALERDQVYDGKYDFFIYDNVGCTNFDYMLVPIGNFLSDALATDLEYIIDEKNVHIIKFGKPAPSEPKAKSEKVKKEKPKKKFGKGKEEETSVEEEIEEVSVKAQPKMTYIDEVEEEEVPDEDFNKWRTKKTEREILREKVTNKNAKWCKFPSIEMFETMEAQHIMPVPDDSIAKVIYSIFQTTFAIEERMYMKGVRLKDESGSIINGTWIR